MLGYCPLSTLTLVNYLELEKLVITIYEEVCRIFGRLHLLCCFAVYKQLSYMEIIGRAAEDSMVAAVEQVKALPEYGTNNGEVRYTITHY